MKPKTGSANPSQGRWRYWPEITLGLFFIYVLAGFQSPKIDSPFNINRFGQLPVLNGGRVKPLDTIARTSLLVISGKQTVHTDEGTVMAMQWLTDVLYNQPQAAAYPVFEIDDPDVLGMMAIAQTNRRRFAWAELESHGAEIEKQANEANQVKPEQRNRFQRAIVNL
ncbi:MAG TPA: hypothetical protein VMU17_00870, partial [Elusimicrobiota bacterium]|nr:hypothetical protein [Elusimicrobiota bacterium]